jgi:two-component system response regulator PilR (NtrC family)
LKSHNFKLRTSNNDVNTKEDTRMLSEPCALIVDDEKDIRSLLSMTFERMGLACKLAANVSEATELLRQNTFHFCITDMKLPDGDGMQLINHCSRNFPEMPVAMITAFGNLELGVNALKAGAFDVVAKPLDTNRLRSLATSALKLSKVRGAIPEQCQSLLVGNSTIMENLRSTVRKVARTQAPALLYGQVGVGKEAVAQAIHSQSSRSEYPFITVNCDALQEGSADDVLFGNTKHNTLGAFREADKGTLVLNDVDRLPADIQAKLLGVLQEKKIHHPGIDQGIAIDARLISTSAADLNNLVEQGSFRQDLYFRLKVVGLEIPSLDNRREDIAQLVEYFLTNYATEWDMPKVSISEMALEALMRHPFKGNIRELDSMLQRAFTLMESDEIQVTDLQFDAPKQAAGAHIHTEALGDLEGYLERLEREAIEEALKSTRWNKTAAAERLGISFRALRYRCKKLDID